MTASTPAAPSAGLHESHLASLPLIGRGKVRDLYAVGDDRLLMVATDRLSAFDVVMGEPIPGKGELLTQLSLFWFDRLASIVPNHLTGDDPLTVVAPGDAEQVRGRSMLVRRLEPIPVEAVVRGYLAGSGWKEYRDHGTVCGLRLPAGLRNAGVLPEPVFTPATKAAAGDHDENIDFDRMVAIVGRPVAEEVRRVSIALYTAAAAHARARGVIIADTKFEFGFDAAGRLVLMDEVLTPDSSRFWPVEAYAAALQAGENPPSFDKQFVRDWLESTRIDGRAWDKRPPAPALPLHVVERTAASYREALRRLIGPALA
jgi:phosphoribosylaminoimidazole-succinocarboxamide synthase